jgi:hypothetical protein
MALLKMKELHMVRLLGAAEGVTIGPLLVRKGESALRW